MRLSRPSYRPASDRPRPLPPAEPPSPSATLQRERCLLGLANATRVLLRHSDLSTAFPRALEHLRAALEVDRLYLCEHHDSELAIPTVDHASPALTNPPAQQSAPAQTALPPGESSDAALHHPPQVGSSTTLLTSEFRLIFEAVGNGISPHSPRWHHWSYEQAGLQRWHSAFRAQLPLGGMLTDFPPREQQLLREEKVFAALMVPIFLSEHELWGYIGCENCHAADPWSLGEKSTLVAFADNLGSAIRRQQGEKQIQFQAFHDLLTGLPNRVLFNHRLPLAIAHARRTQEPLAVMFLDLDRFKQVNDTLGHDYGDQLLIQATQRLQACLREEDILARWGGDEFTLCLPNLQSSDDVIKVSERLLAALRRPFEVNQETLDISGSIGIALYPQDGTDIETLMRHADVALYRVKEEGRNHYQFFHPQMNDLASEQLAWVQALQQALSAPELGEQNPGEVTHNQAPNHLQLRYQPHINLNTGEACGLEALLHWHHPHHGLLAAAEFLPHAKQAGLMTELGCWMIDTLSSQLHRWRQRGICPPSISISLSTQQFQCSEVMAKMTQMLQAHAPIQQIQIELSEASLCQEIQYSQSALRELRNHGVSLVLDQFGENPLEIELFTQLPIDQLKLASSLLNSVRWEREATEADHSLASLQQHTFLATLVSISHSLTIPLVASGVENQQQLDTLRSLNVQKAQGNFISLPQTALEIEQHFLEGNGTWTIPQVTAA